MSAPDQALDPSSFMWGCGFEVPSLVENFELPGFDQVNPIRIAHFLGKDHLAPNEVSLDQFVVDPVK